LAFPSETLDGEAMFLMLKGAMEKLAEANVALVGGHSIRTRRSSWDSPSRELLIRLWPVRWNAPGQEMSSC
jgi:hypothetical protein